MSKSLVLIAAVFLLIFFYAPPLKAQALKYAKADTLKKTDSVKSARAKNIYVEIGGAGLFFSANYDARFSKRKDGWGARIGLGYIDDNGSSFTSIPVQLNYLLGNQGKYFEMGIGATYVYYKDEYFNTSDVVYFDRLHGGASTVLGTMTFGYRYQPIEGGFSFRGSFNPLFNVSNFVPYGGISFGYTFK